MKAITTVINPSHGRVNTLFGKNPMVKKLPPAPRKLCIPDNNGLQILSFEDILYFKSNGNYTEINLINGQHFIFAKTLKTFQAVLPDQFFRTHNQYIVNKIYINRIEHSGVIKLLSNDLIPISRGRRTSFHSWMMDATMISV